MNKLVHWVLLTIHQEQGQEAVLTVQGSRNPLELFPAVLEEVTKDYHFPDKTRWKEAIETLRRISKMM